MTIFGAGKNERQRKPQAERVEVSTTLNQYRFANWDPYAFVHEIDSASVDAQVEGDHLWNSSEELQALTVATWMASSRQVVGNILTGSATEDAPDGKIPKDVETAALANYSEALRWLEWRDDIAASGEYQQSTSLVTQIDWPKSSATTPLSQELLVALKGAAEYLCYVQHAVIEAAVNVTHTAEFNAFDVRIKREFARLESSMRGVNRLWNDQLDPNVTPGSEVYQHLVDAIENLLELGAFELMPVLLDPNLRLLPRERELDLPKFNPKILGSSSVKHAQNAPPPELRSFDPNELQREASPAPQQSIPSVTPNLPNFDPWRLKQPHPRPTETTPEPPALPRFDPSTLHQTSATAEPVLPSFDPEALNQSPKSRKEESNLPAFDPSQLKNRRPAPDEKN